VIKRYTSLMKLRRRCQFGGDTTLFAESGEDLPGAYVIRADVQTCLLDAMTDCFPISRDEIEADTVPSKKPIGADAQGWGICLVTYAGNIKARRAAYAAYTHRPRYTQETFDKPFPEIVDYFQKELLAQVTGQ